MGAKTEKDEDREEAMSAGSSIPIQVFQGLAKGELFGEVQTSFGDLTEAMDSETRITEAVPALAGGRHARGGALKSVSASERDVLLMEHLPTVRYLARRIHERLPQHVDLDDLVSAGVVGLIDALSKFDRSKKVQFKSYAQFRIRGAILDSLRTLDWSPRDLRRKGRAVEEAIRAVTQRVGGAPSEQEIAREMELSLSE